MSDVVAKIVRVYEHATRERLTRISDLNAYERLLYPEGAPERSARVANRTERRRAR